MVDAQAGERDLASALIRKVEADRAVPPVVRRLTARVAGTYEDPILAIRRLQAEAERHLPAMARHPARQPLARVVTAATFLRHYTNPTYRDAFSTPEDFVAFVGSGDAPEKVLQDALTTADPLFSWRRSWLTPARSMAGRSASALLGDLEMPGEPPVVIFRFSLASMTFAGVDVRPPCALDAVLGPNYQWRSGGPASGVDEFVDGDIPRDALTAMEWRA